MESATLIRTIEEQVLRQTGMSLSRGRARVGFGRGHLLQLVFYLEGASGSDDDRAAAAAELAAERLLGSQLFEDWVGSVSCQPLRSHRSLPLVEGPEKSAPTVPLGELASLVRTAVDGLLAGLPDAPLWSRSFEGDWVLLDAEPSHDPGGVQPDLLLAATALPELLKCALQGSPFSSCRFSKVGERFVYLAYRCTDGSFPERVAARQRLEDALDATVRAEQLGCVIGNGTGRHHCYIDLALSASERALGRVARAARQVGLGCQSWVRFFDSAKRHDWLGVWDETPAPPLSGSRAGAAPRGT